VKSILITGAHGFIGRHLARYCKFNCNASVAGLGHGTFSGSELTLWGLTSSLNGDVSFANLDRVAEESGVPEVIFHLAGGNSVGPSLRIPQEDFRRTVASTCELLDWVKTNAPQTTIVLASSAAVYGSDHCERIYETSVAMPYSPYGYHKRMAELLCESYAKNFGLKTRVVRLFSVYGPELRKQLLWDTCQKLSTGIAKLVMHGSGNENRDWLHVSDCAAFLCKLAEADSVHCVVNCGTGIATPVNKIVEAICHNWDESIEYTFNGQARPGDPTDLVADTTKANSMGWTPNVEWQTGIAEYVHWFRKTVKGL